MAAGKMHLRDPRQSIEDTTAVAVAGHGLFAGSMFVEAWMGMDDTPFTLSPAQARQLASDLLCAAVEAEEMADGQS